MKEVLGEWLELCLELLQLLLLVLILNVKALLGHALKLLALKLLEVLDSVLIDRVNHVKHLETLLAEGLDEWRGGDSGNTLTSDVIDVGLTLLHAVNILLQADLLVTRFGGVVAHELSNLGTVR